MSKYYGVSQSNHGHEYRFIFKKEDIEKHISMDEADGFCENESIDVGFPIYGSNASATVFEPISSDEEARFFLLRPAEGPDVDDPMLVDLAEYLLTIYTDSDSSTQEFLDRLGLDARDLEQYDDKSGRLEKSENMIAKLLDSGTDYDHVIDRDNPFYGFSSRMRYSELCDIYKEFLKGKEHRKETEEEFENKPSPKNEKEMGYDYEQDK